MRLLVSLSLSSRDRDLSVKSRAGLNEVLLVVATQLASRLGDRSPAYPDVAMLETVHEKAQVGGCISQVEWTVREAMRRVDRGRVPPGRSVWGDGERVVLGG